MHIHIIYPEDRWVSADTILDWYRDAIADGVVEKPDQPDALNVYDAIEALNDIGFITTTNEPPRDDCV